MTRRLHRIARWLTGHRPTHLDATQTPEPRNPPPDPHTDIDPYSHVLPPRPRKP